ncbi:MAG: rod shape-determining protein MreC [Candidatus Latescibacteria bacterium]|nr:rod shape-determining protein MreC [Candidatus Latescibacterota bacterium]
MVLAYLSKHKRYVTLICTVVASLTMMILSNDHRKQFAETLSVEVLKTGQHLFSWASHLVNLSDENRFLKEWNIQLSLELSRLRDVEAENVRLRNLLKFKEKGRFLYIPARVIAQDGSRIAGTILIDVGRRDGVQERMPVVTAEGVVGRLLSVRETTAVVQLLLDQSSRVSATIERDPTIVGIVEGDSGEKLWMKKVPFRSDVQIGDTVISSGMGGVFPEGLRIGSVALIEEEKTGLFKEVVVDPMVRFGRLYEVFVLTNEKP